MGKKMSVLGTCLEAPHLGLTSATPNWGNANADYKVFSLHRQYNMQYNKQYDRQ